MTDRVRFGLSLVVCFVVALWSGTAAADDSDNAPDTTTLAPPTTIELADRPAPAAVAPAAATHVDPADTDGDLEPAVEDVSDLESPEAAQKDPKAYAALIRRHTRSIRAKVTDKIDAKIAAKQETTMDRMSGALAGFGWLGIFLVLSPLYWRKKFPGRDALLFKYSALSSVMFVVTVNLLSGVLMLLRGAQGVANQFVNPQAAVVEATFETIDKRADELTGLGPQVLGPVLGAFSQSTDESPFVVLFTKVSHVSEQAAVFGKIAAMFKSVDWLMEGVPVVMTLIALVTFAVASRATLMQIVRLPALAASGEVGVGRRVLIETAVRVKNELLATLALVGMLFVVTIAGGLVLKQAIEPAVEALLGFAFTNVVYVLAVKDPSLLMVVVSLGLGAAFLALNIAAVVVPSAMFLSKFHKIMQRRVHERVSLAAHAKFFMFGPLVLFACFLFPVLFILAGEPICEWLVDRSLASSTPSYGLLLLGAPLTLCLGFVVGFAVMCGFGLRFMIGYKPERIGAPMPAKPPTFTVPLSYGPTLPAYVPYLANAIASTPAPTPGSFAPQHAPHYVAPPATVHMHQHFAQAPQPPQASPDRTMPLAAVSAERARELLPSAPPPPPMPASMPMTEVAPTVPHARTLVSAAAPALTSDIASPASRNPKAPLAPRAPSIPPPVPTMASPMRPRAPSIAPPPPQRPRMSSIVPPPPLPRELAASPSSSSPVKKISRPSLPIPLPPPGAMGLGKKTLPPPASRSARGPYALSSLKPEEAAEVLARDLKSDAPPAAPDTMPGMVEDDSPTELMAFSDLVKRPSQTDS